MARLTIPSEPTYVEFTVVAETAAFPIGFALFAKDDITVKVSGVALPQSGFNFAGTLLDGGGYDGGTVTLNTPVSNVLVRIERNVAVERTSNFAPATAVPVQTIDQALNRLTAQAQDVKREADRAHERLDALGSDSAEIALEAKVAAEAARDIAVTKAAEADADAYTAASALAEIPTARDQALVDIAAAKAAATSDVTTDLGTAQALIDAQVAAGIATIDTDVSEGQADIAAALSAGLTDIDNAKTAATGAVSTAQSTATTAVSSAQTTATTAITTAQDAAQAAIATDRAAALAAIAADKLAAAASATAAETSATAAATAKTGAEAARDQMLGLTGAGWPALITGAFPDPVSQALFALQGAWTTQPSAAVLNIYENLLAAMIADGTFDLIDVAWPLFGHSLEAQEISLVRPTAAKKAVAYGAGLTRTPFVGISAENTGLVVAAFGRVFTPDKASINSNALGVFMDQAPTLTGGIMAYGGSSRVGVGASSTELRGRATGGSSTALIVSGAVAADAFYAVDRSDASSAKLFKNGAVLASTTSYASVSADNQLLLFASDTATATSRSNGRAKFAFHSAHLTDSQHASLNTNVRAAAAAMAAFA